MAAREHAPGQAEVEHVRLAGAVDENVGGLQIAMDHAPLVRVRDGVADLGQQLQDLLDFRRRGRLRRPTRPKRAPCPSGACAAHRLAQAEVLFQVAPVDQLHDVVGQSLVG